MSRNRWLSGKILLILLIASFASRGIAADAKRVAPAPKDKVIIDFETDADLARWKPGGVTATLSGEHVTHGKKSVQITFQPGNGLHTFLLTTGKNKFDLSAYTHIAVDVYAPKPIRVTYKLKSDDHKNSWQTDLKLEKGADTIVVSFKKIGINPAKLDYINFFIGNPETDQVLFVDNIRAIVKPEALQSKTPIRFDFESPAELARWKSHSARAELSDEHVTHGKSSVRITYAAGKGLHTFMFDDTRNMLDFSGYTHIAIDVFAPVNMGITLKMKSGDGEVKWERHYTLEPAADTLTVSFDKTGLDPSRISYINLFTGGLQGDTELFIDNIRGMNAGGLSQRNTPKKLEKPDDELF